MANSNAQDIAKTAKAAFEESQLISSDERIKALLEIKNALELNKAEILEANEEDLAVFTSSLLIEVRADHFQAAKQEVDAGRMSESLMKRLDLTKGDKWESMLQGVLDVANLPDPTGTVTYASELDDGLELYRVSCPIGVLLVIFEARPEVVVNIASLAIKSGIRIPLHSARAGRESLTQSRRECCNFEGR